MRNVEYIIVGDGYAALFLAHQMIKNKKSFLLYSEGEKSASMVSAGIINPAVLKRFTTFWLAQEQIDALKNTLTEIEKYTGINYLINEPILRVFHDDKEKELWLKKANDISFLSKDFLELDSIINPFGCGKVNQSARLNVSDFFNDLFLFLDKNGFLVKDKLNYELLDISNSIYQDISFGKIVFAEGMGVKENPYFSYIPVQGNKGHHLEVQLSNLLKEKYTLKKKHFIFPLNNGCYYYGGTYDREQTHKNVDASAVDKLSTALKEFYPNDFKIAQVKFGFRPTVKDRRPILGKHPQYKNIYVFNGLGARGILNGNYFAINLFQHMENGFPIHPEVDLERFIDPNN